LFVIERWRARLALIRRRDAYLRDRTSSTRSNVNLRCLAMRTIYVCNSTSAICVDHADDEVVWLRSDCNVLSLVVALLPLCTALHCTTLATKAVRQFAALKVAHQHGQHETIASLHLTTAALDGILAMGQSRDPTSMRMVLFLVRCIHVFVCLPGLSMSSSPRCWLSSPHDGIMQPMC